jgi:PilZ domain
MSKDAPREERRRSTRVAVDVPVRLRVGKESVPGRMRDICRDAALVEIHRHLELGTEVTLMFELPDEEGGPLQVAGRITRLAPGDGDARGVAVLFRDVHPSVEGRISMFLHRQD